MDENEIQIILKWAEEGRATLDAVKLQLDQLNAANATNAAVTAASGNAAAGAVPAWIALAAAIAVVIGVISPFVIEAGAALIILATFAVAGAGMLGTLGLAALGFGALAGGVLYLADAAGKLDGPSGWASLKTGLTNMADTLGKQATPAALLIIQAADAFIPRIQAMGVALLTWFGPRLPEILSILSGAGNTFLGGLTSVGSSVGSFLDRAISGGSLNQMFQQVTNLGTGAIQGLLGNLLALSNWFEQRLPTYGPIVQQIFGFIGNVIQGVAVIWGKFGDWLVSQWPAITSNASQAVKSITDAWAKWEPQLQAATGYLPLIGTLLHFLAQNAGGIVPVLTTLLGVFLALATAVLAMAAAIAWLLNQLNNLEAWLNAHPLVMALVTSGSSLVGSGSGGGSSGPAFNVPGRPFGGGAANGMASGYRGGNITFNVTGNSNPDITAAVIARNLRKIGVV